MGALRRPKLLKLEVRTPQNIVLYSKSATTSLSNLWAQAESTVHMLNWAIRSVKFLGVEFDQSEDEEIAVSDTTHL